MKYLEKAFKFLAKHYLLALPLWALSLIPGILGGKTINLLADGNYWIGLLQNPTAMRDPAQILNLFASILPLFAGAGILSFILRFVVYPPTYGLINTALSTGHSDLNGFVPSLKENIVKYILYWIGTLVVGIILSIALIIVIAVIGVLVAVLKWFGAIIALLAMLLLIVVGLVIGALLGLWFPAMVVSNLDVIAALKKSVEVVKKDLWMIVGITLLINFVGGIAGSILSFLNFIPLIGPIITSVIPAITTFVLTVFYMMVYKDKTEGTTSVV